MAKARRCDVVGFEAHPLAQRQLATPRSRRILTSVMWVRPIGVDGSGGGGACRSVQTPPDQSSVSVADVETSVQHSTDWSVSSNVPLTETNPPSNWPSLK